MAEKKLNSPFNAIDLIDYQDDSIVSRMIIKGEAGSVTVFAFDGDQSLSEHTVPFDALLNVVEGEATITIGGEDNQVLAGESIVMPRDVSHAVKAKTRVKMILSMVKK